MYLFGVTILCLTQLRLSDTFTDVNCGIRQSNNPLSNSPWLAGIKVTHENTDLIYTLCAGVLLDQQHVLTTAECLIFPNGTIPKAVQLGNRDIRIAQLSQLNLTEEESFYPIKRYLLHPLYRGKMYKNNIGLIQLQHFVYYTEFIQPICTSLDKPPVSPYYAGTWGKYTLTETPKQNIPSLITYDGYEIFTAVELNNSQPIDWQRMLKGSPLVFAINNQFYLKGILMEMVNHTAIYINVYPYIVHLEVLNYMQGLNPVF